LAAEALPVQLDARSVGAVDYLGQRDQRPASSAQSSSTRTSQLVLLVQASVHQLGEPAFDERAAARQSLAHAILEWPVRRPRHQEEQRHPAWGYVVAFS
jgi:hypothetical protein